MADDEVKLLAEAKKWPYSERIAHGSWKVRAAAYDDIRAACAGIYDDTDPLLADLGKRFGQLLTRVRGKRQGSIMMLIVA